jgi:hypothetical protein
MSYLSFEFATLVTHNMILNLHKNENSSQFSLMLNFICCLG